MKLPDILSYLLLLILAFGCQSSTKGQVPEEVKSSFQEKYPGENDPDWHKDQNGNYESQFKKDGDHYRADFSPDGNWIETEQSIDEDDLPKAIKEVLEEEYDKFKIVEVELVNHHSKGMFYDVELKDDGEKIDIEFKENGEIINIDK